MLFSQISAANSSFVRGTERPIAVASASMDIDAAKQLFADNRGSIFPYLELLWDQFPWRECKSRCRSAQKCTGSCGDKVEKIRLLRALAAIKVGCHPNRNRRAAVRADFEANYRGRQNSKRTCFACGGEFHHRHHIIQIQFNGQNAGRNIVRLCRDCHRAVHAA